VRRHLRCSIGGSESANEIPPLGTLLHLSNEETNGLVQSTGCTPSWFGIIGVTRLHAWFTFSTSSGVPREDPTVETLCTNPFAFGCSESLVSRHLPDGEFGWGGISVTQQRRCPKASSVGTEISRGTQASRLA
jgi:hypothetical protein